MSDSYQAIYDAVRSKLSGCDVGEAVAEDIHQKFDISFAIEGLKQDFYYTLAEHRRPFVLMRPRLYPDGNQWCALYGDDLQSGVAGFGDTPAKAAQQFDTEWLTAKAVK